MVIYEDREGIKDYHFETTWPQTLEEIRQSDCYQNYISLYQHNNATIPLPPLYITSGAFVEDKTSFLYNRSARCVRDFKEKLGFEYIYWKRNIGGGGIDSHHNTKHHSINHGNNKTVFSLSGGHGSRHHDSVSNLPLEMQSFMEIEIAKKSACFIPSTTHGSSFSYMVLRLQQLDDLIRRNVTLTGDLRNIPQLRKYHTKYGHMSSWGF
jgi:hypothetical protein